MPAQTPLGRHLLLLSARLSAVFGMLSHRLVDVLPLPFLFRRRRAVQGAFEMSHRPLQLQITRPSARLKPTVCQRIGHGATRFCAVPTIPIPAARSQAGDVGKCHVKRRLTRPQSQLPQARRIDQRPSSRQRKQHPIGRRMLPTRIVHPYRASYLPLFSQQTIDDCRFSHARRAK